MKSIALVGLIMFAAFILRFVGEIKIAARRNEQWHEQSSNSSSLILKNELLSTDSEKADPNPISGTSDRRRGHDNWDQQGINWTVPKGWKKSDVSKLQFNYASPDNAFLLVSISEMSDDFPMDISLKAYYDQAMQQLKQGHYEMCGCLTLTG